MASSSSSHPRNEKHDAFSGIEPLSKRRKVDESSRLFDVFINHRGPDVKQTVALQLYKSLKEVKIRSFLDSEEKELGDSFPSTIENAIHSASVHLAIFSNGYAESPWCLAELVLMLHSTGKIIPLFYGVKPSDLRYVEKGEYAKAFTKYEEKGRYMEKLKEWKEALQSVSFLTGHEISSNFNISDCQNIVSAVQKEVQRKIPLHVAKHPMGLHRLVEDFERQYPTNEGGKEKAQAVGIFGMGGVGKTTLAKKLFNREKDKYKRACFLFYAREAYVNNRFPDLQLKLLKELFQQDELNFHCIEEGKIHIGECIRKSKQLRFLIVVDDIDHVQQLEALLILEMLKKSVDSLVIVTTRDVGVLVNAGITSAYNLKGMDRDHARELFCWYAFGQPHPAKDYEDLVNSFLNVCQGLPLSLEVLGSHVHGRDQNYWSLELKKVSKALPRDIHQRLKISFDALEYEEQQIFIDIACFFVDKLKSIALKIWEASGWSAQHALKTLEDKCLVRDSLKDRHWVSVGEDRSLLSMHDHLRDLGREMANDPRYPRRLWRRQDLKYLESKEARNIIAQTEGSCFRSILVTGYRVTYFVGKSDVSAERSTFLVFLELEYQGFQKRGQLNLDFKESQPSIPSWIPLQNLRCLIVRNLHWKALWQSHVQAPTQLKELQIHYTSLEDFSDLLGISNSLEKFTINFCKPLKTLLGLSSLRELTELNISNCSELQEISVVQLSCLEKILLHNCYNLIIVSGLSDLRKLVELNITQCPTFKQLRLVSVDSLKRITVDYSLKPTCFELVNCRNLKTVSANFSTENLESIIIRDCPKIEMLPSLEYTTNKETITIDGCGKLNGLQLSKCPNLKRVKSNLDLARLCISDCPELEQITFSTFQTCIEEISIVRWGKLQHISCSRKLVELVTEGCRELKTVTVICDYSECLELQDLSSVARPSFLKSLTIETCDKLQTIQGIDELHALENLELLNCAELEELSCSALQTCLKKISIVGCWKLQNITLPTKLVSLKIEECIELKTVTVICDQSECLELQDSSSVARLSCGSITINSCDKLQTIQGIDELHALENLELFNCAELEELSCSALQTCLKNISIVECGKLQNITLPTKLVSLEIEECRELKTVTVICDQSECLELQNSSSVARQSILKWMTIRTCDNLQTIQGIDELQAFKTIQLSYCSNATIRNWIPILKSLPSELLVIGRAVYGALSTLNSLLFSDADAPIENIGTRKSRNWQNIMSELSVVILCSVFEVNSCTPIDLINQSFEEFPWSLPNFNRVCWYSNSGWSKFRVPVEQGEWIITIVITGEYKEESYNGFVEVEDVLVEHGMVKEEMYVVGVKKGEEWKTQHVLRAIIDRLYQN